MVLLLLQLDARYGVEGLTPGRLALLEVVLRDGQAGDGGRPEVQLDAPDGLAIVGEPVWIPSKRELTWRVRAAREGSFALGVRHASERVSKAVVAGTSDRFPKAASRVRPAGVADRLLSVEAPIPADSAFESISITYAPATLLVLGWRVHWSILFLILSLLFALLLRRPLGVII